MKRKKNGIGKVQGHALLYGRTSKAIRIVFGEVVGKKEDRNDRIRRTFSKIKQTKTKKQEPKRRKISDDTIKKLDTLKDPLEMMSKFDRTQKYDAAKSNEKYEYGLSDW